MAAARAPYGRTTDGLGCLLSSASAYAARPNSHASSHREALNPDEDVDALLELLEEEDDVAAQLREQRMIELQRRYDVGPSTGRLPMSRAEALSLTPCRRTVTAWLLLRAQKLQELEQTDHGKYVDVTVEKELLRITTTEPFVVAHFCMSEFRRCKIVDAHLKVPHSAITLSSSTG